MSQRSWKANRLSEPSDRLILMFMYVIPELCLKGFELVSIPSPAELFRIYGGRVGNVSSSTSDVHDFSNPVNLEGYSKVDMLGSGLAFQRDSYLDSLTPSDEPAESGSSID